MPVILETYSLGNITVTIQETDNPQKVLVRAVQQEKEMTMLARVYEYKNYTRLMNQKIIRFFKEEAQSG